MIFLSIYFKVNIKLKIFRTWKSNHHFFFVSVLNLALNKNLESLNEMKNILFFFALHHKAYFPLKQLIFNPKTEMKNKYRKNIRFDVRFTNFPLNFTSKLSWKIEISQRLEFSIFSLSWRKSKKPRVFLLRIS